MTEKRNNPLDRMFAPRGIAVFENHATTVEDVDVERALRGIRHAVVYTATSSTLVNGVKDVP
jgi:hypothetical protein